MFVFLYVVYLELLAMGLRIDKRSKVNIAVRLYNPNFGYFDAYTRDISDSGFFIDTKPYLGLQEDTEQKMVLLNSELDNIIFNVEFVRESEYGLGFRFIDYETDGERHELDELKHIWVTRKQVKEHQAA